MLITTSSMRRNGSRRVCASVARSLAVLAAVPVIALLTACGGGGPPAGTRWVAAWAAAMQASAGAKESPLAGGRAVDQTLRLIAPLTATGDSVRVRLSNVYGDAPVQFRTVTVAIRREGASLAHGTLRQVTFQGSPSVAVATGGQIVSDPVTLGVRQGDDLAVSLYLPGRSPLATWHARQPTTSYLNQAHGGDVALNTGASPFARAITAVPWLTAVDVLSSQQRGSAIVLGDSLTDGARLPPDRRARWTDALASRLRVLPAGHGEAVVNAGIGDGLTSPGSANLHPDWESRLARDVLAQAGANELVLALGINDVATGESAARIEQAMLSIAQRARKAGLRVLAATLGPTALLGSSMEPVRIAVNGWIRKSGTFDGVIDFDAVLHDLVHPGRLSPAYDSGDHFDPNARGQRAIADSIDLRQLAAPRGP